MADPERLGKYEIRGALGKGAMGVVYRGFDPHIEREVAIKTIRKDLVEPELAVQYMARFRNEAKAAGRLHHPNIVGVYEFGEDAAVTFIAMEYVEGTGLREYLNRHTSFDFAQLTALMTQLLGALEFAHGRGVVHRDIKPSNLIVTSQGVLKVADFGVARVDTSNLTTAGMVIGTPSYMSPEQCRGLEADARSDLFSTGVVLYELLTGEKPFRGSVEAVAYKICHEEPEPPSRRAALRMPAAVDQLVATALAKVPANRFPTARAFHDALDEVARMSVEVDNGLGATMVSIGTLMLQRPAPTWDEETLRTAEYELAHALGPMARVMVRRAAEQTNDRGELCSILSECIVDPETRRKFVVGVRSHRQRRAYRRCRWHRRGRDGRVAARAHRSAGEPVRIDAPERDNSAGRCARAGVRRPDHHAAGRLSRPHRQDRHEEVRSAGEDPRRVRQAGRGEPGHAGSCGVPARSRVRRRLGPLFTGAPAGWSPARDAR